MPNETIRERDYAGPFKVWHNADIQHPSVSIGVGPFWACIKPYEARELAHALIEAANEATSQATAMPVASVREVW